MVVLMTSVTPHPVSSKSKLRLSKALLACPYTSSETKFKVMGSIPICPETNIKPLQIATLEQGPMGLGPLRVLKVLNILLMIQLTFQLQVIVYYNIMCEAALIVILERIRSLSQSFSGIKAPQKIEHLQNDHNFDSYFQVLDQIQAEIIKCRQIEEEYSRLQALLQQEEAINRRKIGFQQQMRLYCDSLKAHILDLEIEKHELLENSKAIIKDLKKVNEKLYLKANADTVPNATKTKSKRSDFEGRGLVTDRTRAFSLKKSQNSNVLEENNELGEILKTELVERHQEKPMNGAQREKKRNKRASNFSIFQKIRDQVKVFNIKQNCHTFQILDPKTERDHVVNSKKKHKRLISNISFCQYAKEHRKEQEHHLRSCYLKKATTDKQDKQKLKNRLKILHRSAWKDRNNNRSVQSAGSMQVATSAKQTL